MKLLSTDIPLPPLPPAPPPTPETPEVASASDETTRRGRPAYPTPDPRMAAFAKWMADTNRSALTIGSYCASVSSILRRGVAPDAHETAIAGLELSPASHALYLRAWRNWLRFIGATPLPAQVAKAKKAATALCMSARGRKKPTLGDLKETPWDSLKLLTIDGVQHFTLSNGTSEWLWERTDERVHHINELLELAYGGPLPHDDAAYARAIDALATTKVYA